MNNCDRKQNINPWFQKARAFAQLKNDQEKQKMMVMPQHISNYIYALNQKVDRLLAENLELKRALNAKAMTTTKTSESIKRFASESTDCLKSKRLKFDDKVPIAMPSVATNKVVSVKSKEEKSKNEPELINLDDDESESGEKALIMPTTTSLQAKVVVRYPPEEKKQILLLGQDLMCLRDGQYLNDNIVNFYMKHWEKTMLPENLRDRIFIYDALFSVSLTNLKKGMFDDRLKSWTKGVDIFKKDYLFVPFIKDKHWFLVILCNIYNLMPKVQTPSSVAGEPKKATIIFMNSLCNDNDSEMDLVVKSNVKALLKYLKWEFNEKNWNCGPKVTRLSNYQILTPKVPQQPNLYDCGLFVLKYFEYFLTDPENVLACLQNNPRSLANWFKPKRQKKKRSKIRQLIVSLMSVDDVNQLNKETVDHKGV